jgi:exonuclease SbcD
VRLAVFADLHLDTTFAWARPETARRRRQGLRDTLVRIMSVAEETRADAILCAGDLYERERFTPDTREFLRATFGSTRRPVFLAPGNHDCYEARSLYEQVRWPANVHVFREPALTPFELAEGLTLWGAAFDRPTRMEGFLPPDFRVPGGGVHLALFHGSEKSGMPHEVSGKAPHAPFDAAEIERAGLHHAFVGHYHSPRDADRYTYPGNPDPLTFGERGDRGLVIVEVGPDGTVARERWNVAVSVVHDIVLDVSGCASVQDVRERASNNLLGLGGAVRVTLRGETAPSVRIDARVLDGLALGLDELVVRLADLRPGYDLEAIAAENTVRGEFVRDVREAEGLEDEERRRILVTGLRAFEERDDLEVP